MTTMAAPDTTTRPPVLTGGPGDDDPYVAPAFRTPAFVRHSLTFAWRATLKIRNSPEQLMDVTIQPIIFVLLFVFVFGGAVSGDWHDYLQYLMPGIIAQTLLFATMATGVGLNTDVNKGVFDRFRSLPIVRSAPLAGYILGDLVRCLTALTVLLAFSSAIGFRIHTDPLQAIAACLLAVGFALCTSWIFAWVGMVVKSPESVQGFAFIVIFPLTFGSSAFTKVSTMPGWLQAWVKVNPVTHLADACRGLMLGGPVASPVIWTVGWAVGIAAVFAPLAVRAYRRRTD